jgi:hypothetical protein
MSSNPRMEERWAIYIDIQGFQTIAPWLPAFAGIGL